MKDFMLGWFTGIASLAGFLYWFAKHMDKLDQ